MQPYGKQRKQMLEICWVVRSAFKPRPIGAATFLSVLCFVFSSATPS
jgi:hypothetical protein